MGIEGKVAVVTGAGQGIGAEYAKELARLGAKVAVADINAEAAALVAKQIQRSGGQAMGMDVDVSDPASVASLAALVQSQLGETTILVNNAAIYHSMQLTPVLETDYAYWRRVFAVNVDGVFLCTKAFAPQMIAGGWGRIVNQSSIAAYSRGVTHYSVSKLAVVGLTSNLAFELGRYGITVNAIAPGVVMTEATRVNLSQEILDQLLAQTPIKKRAMPTDLLGALRFLVDDDSDWMTGQTLVVDGGLTFHL